MPKLRKPVAYVSSSSEELKEYRHEALNLLNHVYGFDGVGMEQYRAADTDIVRKCQRDAAAADFLILIVGFRYGTPQDDFGGKSVTELEYEAATEAKRDVLAFCLDEKFRLDSAYDDRIQLDDRGANIRRFRDRLIQDHRLVQTFDNLQSFSDVVGRTLAWHFASFIRQQAEDLNRNGAGEDPVESALRKSVQSLLENQKDFDQRYVPLAGMTTKPRSDDWSGAFDGRIPSLEAGDFPGGADELMPLDNVLEALNYHTQFYLVGEPGGGKSETLLAFELEAARRFSANPSAEFPLSIDVSMWLPSQRDFLSLVVDELKSKTAGWPYPPERLLLLLDGAIDSAEARADDPVEKIANWLRAHPRCRAVLAVRLRPPSSGNLPVVRIHPLDNDRVREFVVKRLGEEQGMALLERIGWNSRSAANGRDVRALMRNPFNLTLICRLQTPNKPPTTQSDLIRQVVLTRVAAESVRRGMPALTRQFINAFGSVAIAIIRNRGLLASDVGEVMNVVSDVGELLDLLTLAFGCRVIQERAGRKGFEFAHRLYLEYLAAEYFRAHRDEIEKSLPPPRYENGQRISEKFDEVIHTLLELEPSISLIETVTRRDPFLAASCLSSIPEATDDRQLAEITIAAALIQVLRNSDGDGREAASGALAQIGPSAVEYLRRSLGDDRKWVRRTAVRTLARIPFVDAVKAVVRSLGDMNRWVREDAVFAIRHFDDRSKRLLLQLINSPAWKSDGHDRQIDERLAMIFNELDPAVADALFVATGVKAPSKAIEVVAPTAEAQGESEEDSLTPGVGPSSWGLGWLADWHADPGNPELATRGLTWLGRTSEADPTWADVWVALWRSKLRHFYLERLGRQWIQRAAFTATSWAHVWLALLRSSPKHQPFTDKGWHWLRAVPLDHRDWPLVWAELWHLDDNRKELRDLGHTWLHAADMASDGWAQVWSPLWASMSDRPSLEQLGRRWVEHAPVQSASWGPVWSALWNASHADRDLIRVGMAWIQHASPDHEGWGQIFPPLWSHLRDVTEVEAIGRQWLDHASTSHRAWSYIWESLWKTIGRDERLRQQGRRWLSAVSRSNSSWTRVWAHLWEEAEGDPGLAFEARGWLREKSRNESDLGSILPLILKFYPADPELLEMGYTFFEIRSRGSGAGSGAFQYNWVSVWKALWDYGGDRALLAQSGRQWILAEGRSHSGFSLVWERLWMQSPKDDELRRLGLAWLRHSPKDRTWSHGWEELWNVSPNDPELVELATGHLKEVDAVDWGFTWRALADSGMEDPQFLERGLDWVNKHTPKSRGWAYVWTYFVTRAADRSLLERGWQWMDAIYFGRNTWPKVWETLWQYDPAQRMRLAAIAVDWLARRGISQAKRIMRWNEIANLPLDEPRLAILDGLLNSN